jgi:hypothetical protein
VTAAVMTYLTTVNGVKVARKDTTVAKKSGSKSNNSSEIKQIKDSPTQIQIIEKII